MSSNFFTRTKGDRRDATERPQSNEAVFNPARCYSMENVDKQGSVNGFNIGSKEPSYFAVDQASQRTSPHKRRTHESTTLRPGAAQYTRGQLEAMNNTSRSPHISVRLLSQHGSTGFVYTQGRSRSHTAPSTSPIKAPCVEPVELPGSLLIGVDSSTPLHRSANGGGLQPYAIPQTNASSGASIERPHSSPYSQQSLANYSCEAREVPFAQAPPHPRAKTASPQLSSKKVDAAVFHHSHGDSLVGYQSDSTVTSLKRPSLSVVQRWPTRSSSASGSLMLSQNNSAYMISHPGSTYEGTLELDAVRQTDSVAALLNQISSMHASHEAHLGALKRAHEKELEFHRSYISFLERRPVVSEAPPRPINQSVTIDTFSAMPKGDKLLSDNASMITIQPKAPPFEHQKWAFQETVVESEALKRKLSLSQKAAAEAGEARRERDNLRNIVDRSDRRISQLKDIVRKAKDHEKTLKNSLADLETRLVAAQNGRTDVPEGLHNMCKITGEASNQELTSRQEIENPDSQLHTTDGRRAPGTISTLPETDTNVQQKDMGAELDFGRLATGSDTMAEQLHSLERLIAEKDVKIQMLEQQSSEASRSAIQTHLKRVEELEADLQDHKRMLAAMTADCDRYNSLLYNELRRQSRAAAQKTHPLLEAKVSAEAATQTRSIAQGIKASASGDDMIAARLESEVEHNLKAIILYKFDIKGYKKDLKKAQAQIESLRAMRAERPPTPDRESTSNEAKSNRNYEMRRVVGVPSNENNTTSGLDTALARPPQVGTRTVASATIAALLSTTPAAPQTIIPPQRPKTPLGSHKKLPRPLPAAHTPDPSTAQMPARTRLQQGQMLRSPSESIISCYADRDTREGDSRLTTSTSE